MVLCSWKIIFIALWYVALAFFKTKGITIAVYFKRYSERCVLFIFRVHLNLIIPWEAIHEGYSFKPHVLSIMTSVIGRENSSLGQAAIRSWKLMQIQIFPFFWGRELCWPPNQDLIFSDEIRVYKLLDFWFNCFHNLETELSLLLLDWLVSELMLRRCIEIWGSSPGMSS